MGGRVHLSNRATCSLLGDRGSQLPSTCIITDERAHENVEMYYYNLLFAAQPSSATAVHVYPPLEGSSSRRAAATEKKHATGKDERTRLRHFITTCQLLRLRCAWNYSAIVNHARLIFPSIIDARTADYISTRTRTGACTINRPCAQQYVGKYQSCMVISGRLIVHAPV